MASKYTKSAKGQECQIRIPGVCNHNPETTVPCHLNGAGMALKHLDIHQAFGCSSCHDIVDFRPEAKKHDFTRDEIKLMHLEGVIRTQIIMVKEGILKL